MNILVVHNYYKVPGGEDTVVKNEVKMLKKHGHNIIFYSRNNSDIDLMGILKKVRLPFTMIFSLRTYREVRRIIKYNQIDIVHIHNTLTLISPSVYYAAIHSKVPVVQTIHNFRLLCVGATFYRDGHICEDCLENGMICAIRRRCYRDSILQTLICVISAKLHRVLGVYGKLNYICLTDFTRKKLMKLKQINSQKVFIKPNFVDDTEKIIPYEKRKKQFIFVGRLDKLKGIDFLFKEWRIMGNSAPKLIVCGVGPMEKWCKQYIQENEIYTIEMKGFVPNEDVKKIIAESKALILPTRWYEGFPMTIVESYAVGTPVIGSNIGNVGTLIEDGITGWKIGIDNLKDIVIKILEYDMTDDIRKKFLNMYTENANYFMLYEIYRTIIGNMHDE